MENEQDKYCFVYIDGANLDKGTTESGWKVDYARFYIWLNDRFQLERAYIFIGYVQKYENLYSKMRSSGFTLIFKDVTSDEYGKTKGNCDADLVIYAMRDVYENAIKRAVLVSSDGDFSSLVSFLTEKKIEVDIVSPSDRCSFLLRKKNLPIIYLSNQKEYIDLSC